MKSKISVGIITESLTVPYWVSVMCERIQRGGFAEISLIITTSDNYLPTHKTPSTTPASLYGLYEKLERTIVNLKYDPFKETSIISTLSDIDVLFIQPTITNSSTSINDNDVEKIREHKPDIIFAVGFANLAGRILTLPQYGVWAYDRRKQPTGYWEIVDGHDVTGLTLKRFTENPNNEDQIIAKSFSATNTPFPLRNRSQNYWKSAYMFPRELERLHRLGEHQYFQLVKHKYSTLKLSGCDVQRRPNNIEFLRGFVIYFLNYLQGKLLRAYKHPQWILLFDMHHEMSKSFQKYRRILPPKDRFWADPHVVQANDTYYVFIEELQFTDNRGFISVIEMDENGNYSAPRVVLRRPYHLSYPFIFSYEDVYYMIPESAENETIEVYKAVAFPDQWEHHLNIMDNVQAFDTTLYFYNGKWWMFTNIREAEMESPDDELFLFFSDNPLSEQWQSHPMNPIVSDARRARPAGCIFERDGK